MGASEGCRRELCMCKGPAVSSMLKEQQQPSGKPHYTPDEVQGHWGTQKQLWRVRSRVLRVLEE